MLPFHSKTHSQDDVSFARRIKLVVQHLDSSGVVVSAGCKKALNETFIVDETVNSYVLKVQTLAMASVQTARG